MSDNIELLLSPMDAFSPTPPEWTNTAVHAMAHDCPTCRATALEAQKVWLNRRSPVYGHDRKRKWQEFYHCGCGTAWWAWSSDRPPNEFADRQPPVVGFDDFLGHF
jgi:hypothetical protein